MRITKTVDVDIDLDAEDFLDWLDSASRKDVERIARLVAGAHSLFARHCRSESCVAERPTVEVELFCKPDTIRTVGILSRCGRFVAHVVEPDVWRNGDLDWSAKWRVSHIRTGLGSSPYFPTPEIALQLLDDLARLEFDDFGTFGDAGTFPKATQDTISAAVRPYREGRS